MTRLRCRVSGRGAFKATDIDKQQLQCSCFANMRICLRGLIRFDTNQAVQLRKTARGLKFWIWKVAEFYYLCGENKGADPRAADLRLCFCIYANSKFHDRKSRDSKGRSLSKGEKQTQKKLNDSCKTGFAISVNTGQICFKFEADTSGNV